MVALVIAARGSSRVIDEDDADRVVSVEPLPDCFQLERVLSA